MKRKIENNSGNCNRIIKRREAGDDRRPIQTLTAQLSPLKFTMTTRSYGEKKDGAGDQRKEEEAGRYQEQAEQGYQLVLMECCAVDGEQQQ